MRIAALSLCLVLATAAYANAQVTTLEPIVVEYAPASSPQVVWRPVVADTRPSLVGNTTVTTAGTTAVVPSTRVISSVPYTVSSPVVTSSAPVVTSTTVVPYTVMSVPTVVAPAPYTVRYGGTTVLSPVAPVTVAYPNVTVAPLAPSYYVGRGILGQPVAYVPGQPVRNALRWVSP